MIGIKNQIKTPRCLLLIKTSIDYAAPLSWETVSFGKSALKDYNARNGIISHIIIMVTIAHEGDFQLQNFQLKISFFGFNQKLKSARIRNKRVQVGSGSETIMKKVLIKKRKLSPKFDPINFWHNFLFLPLKSSNCFKNRYVS